MTNARIVVGVDGSDCSRQALRWALDEAGRRGATLDVVHVWTDPMADVSPYGVSAYVDPADVAAGAKRLLDEILAGEVGVAHSSVIVNPVVAEGHAPSVLVESARGADLLVVGSHGRGGFAGLLLGSVSQQCTQHAPCPVVVVRA